MTDAGVPGTSAIDESRLDALLVALLAAGADSVADAFAERTLREQAGADEGGRARPGPSPVVSRTEEGLALRLVSGGRVRAALAGGSDPEAVLALATWLADGAGGRAPLLPPAAGPAPPAPPLPGASPAAVVPVVAAAARRSLAGRPELVGFEIEAARESREIHVASSEWGHARERRWWATLSVTACASRGGVEARARRGLGSRALVDSTTPAGRDLLAAVVEEAAAAAAGLLDGVRLVAVSGPILFAPGSGAALFHETLGHALEGDVVARGESAVGRLVGERVAAPFLTVVDDPTMPGLAGSHVHDDEGVPARGVRLLDAGVIGGPVTDGASVAFDPARTTGHGRRASWRELPRPRLTNTAVLPGPHDEGELLRGVTRGLWVERLDRAAFDPRTGRVQLGAPEARLVEDGRLTAPVADLVLVGEALDVLRAVDGVGHVTRWDDGCGTCGREGHWLRVAVGGPLVRLAEGALGVG
jgi:TldD protein